MDRPKYTIKPIKITEGRSVSSKLIKGIDKINKINPALLAMKNKNVSKGMNSIGKFTYNKLLPAVVSTGIPLASSALGAVASAYGGPVAGDLVGNLSQNLMEGYIPKQYQSNNKYVNTFAEALNGGLNQDPYAMMKAQNSLMNNVNQDLYKMTTKKQSKIPNQINSYFSPEQPIPTAQYYNPDSPHQDYLMQMLKNIPLTQQNFNDTNSNTNDDNDALYSNDKIGHDADYIQIDKSPYSQKEGSISGLLGAGIKKKRSRGRPRKNQIVEIYDRPYYKRYKNANNASLDQLIAAKQHKQEIEDKKLMRKMALRQLDYDYDM